MPSRQQLLDLIHLQADVARLGLDLARVIALVAERTLGLVGADAVVVDFADDEDVVSRAAAAPAHVELGQRLSREDALSGFDVATAAALRCDDAFTDPRVDGEACRRVGFRSLLVVPFHHSGTIVGVLKAVSIAPHKFHASDERLLSLLAEAIGASMFFSATYDPDLLFRHATHDRLTALPNRSLFLDRLRTSTEIAARDGSRLGVVMLGLDDFKAVNDEGGRELGDAILAEVGRRLLATGRRSDTPSRLGGDTFAILLSPLDTAAGVDVARRRIEAALAAPFTFGETTAPLLASLGAATLPEDGTRAEQLLEAAEARMHDRKRARREG